MVKIVKFLVRIISEQLLKAIFLMFETETVGPCMVPLAPQWLRPCFSSK